MKRFNGLKAVLFSVAAFALVCLTFSTKVSAATEDPTPIPAAPSSVGTMAYDANKDALMIQNTSSAAVKFSVLSAKKNEETTASKPTYSKSIDGSTTAAFTLSKTGTKKAAINVAVNKDGYFFLTDKTVNKKGKFTPSLTVSKTPIKKLVVALNYVNVGTGSGFASAPAVASITYTLDNEDKTPKTVATTTGSNTYDGYKLEYSVDDGKTWVDGVLTGQTAYSRTGKKIMFRIAGTDSPAVRPSKAVSVTVKKAGKAPKIAINADKGTIGLKNGMSYYVVTSGSSVSTSNNDWKVIPVANGKSENEITSANYYDKFIAADTYVPKKFDKSEDSTDATSLMFTKTKINGVDLSWVASDLSTNAKVIYVRTEATVSAPASAVTTVTLAAVRTAPQVHVTSATTASAIKLTVTGSATTGITYEYCVLPGNITDPTSVDVKWTKGSPDGKIKSNSKSTAYKEADGTKNVAESVEAGFKIWIREKGDSKKLLLPSASVAITITNVDTDEKQIGATE